MAPERERCNTARVRPKLRSRHGVDATYWASGGRHWRIAAADRSMGAASGHTHAQSRSGSTPSGREPGGSCVQALPGVPEEPTSCRSPPRGAVGQHEDPRGDVDVAAMSAAQRCEAIVATLVLPRLVLDSSRFSKRHSPRCHSSSTQPACGHGNGGFIAGVVEGEKHASLP